MLLKRTLQHTRTKSHIQLRRKNQIQSSTVVIISMTHYIFDFKNTSYCGREQNKQNHKHVGKTYYCRLQNTSLQETHSTKDDLIRWQHEWKNCGSGNSFFNCATSDSRGVGILLGKKFKENVEFFSQDNNSGRILRSTLKINDSTFYISNIYAPNNGKDRKSFVNAINDTLFKYTDDSDKIYSLILGDFNCAIKKNLDRNLLNNQTTYQSENSKACYIEMIYLMCGES